MTRARSALVNPLREEREWRIRLDYDQPIESTWLDRLRLALYAVAVLALLVTTLINKWLPSEQREMRRQLVEAVEIMKRKQTGTLVAPATMQAVFDPDNRQTIALRRQFANQEVEQLLASVNDSLSRYERFEVDESALKPFLDTMRISHEAALPALTAAVQREPNSTSPLLARGLQQAALAWTARGGDYATRTPPHKFEKMTEWQLAAAADLLEVVRRSPRPTAAVVQLLGFARTYNHAKVADELFAEAIRVDPQSAMLFDERVVHLDGKWGHKTIEDNYALLVMARTNGVRSASLDQTARFLDYNSRGLYASTKTPNAVELARDYAKNNDNFDAWLWLVRVLQANGRFEELLIAATRAAHHDPNSVEVDNAIGYALESLKRDGEAIAHYQRAAARGSNYAQQRLIDAYTWSWWGLSRDWDTIRRLCEASASMLNAAGEFCVGGLYFDGLAGYPRDANKAAVWFRRAAEKFHDTGQHDFGWMLVKGLGGLSVDRAEGVYWLRQAANQGFTKAEEKLAAIGESREPLSHRWWQVQSTLKRIILPWFWPLLDRLPAF